MAGRWVLAGVLAMAGFVVASIGWQQRRGRLRRNWLAGLRTSETLRSDEAWHAAHLATWGLVVAAGVLPAAAAVLLVLLRPTRARRDGRGARLRGGDAGVDPGRGRAREPDRQAGEPAQRTLTSTRQTGEPAQRTLTSTRSRARLGTWRISNPALWPGRPRRPGARATDWRRCHFVREHTS